MSHWGDFKHVRGRNKRRKQAKRGKFDKEKYTNYKSNITKPEYDFPNLKEPELDRLKGKIKNKMKTEKRRSLIFFLVFAFVLIYLLYYLVNRFL